MRQFQHSTSSSEPALNRASPRNILRRALAGVTARLLFADRAPARRQDQRALSEPLEKRQLLSTIFGGETLIFESFDFGEVDDDGEIETMEVHLQVQGNRKSTRLNSSHGYI